MSWWRHLNGDGFDHDFKKCSFCVWWCILALGCVCLETTATSNHRGYKFMLCANSYLLKKAKVETTGEDQIIEEQQRLNSQPSSFISFIQVKLRLHHSFSPLYLFLAKRKKLTTRKPFPSLTLTSDYQKQSEWLHKQPAQRQGADASTGLSSNPWWWHATSQVS